MERYLSVKIKHRRDTSANWTTLNPVLLYGEIILVDTENGELRAKIGDGLKTYTQLPFSDEALKTLIGSKANTSDIPSASAALPEENGTASVGTSNDYARADHVHPASPAAGGHANTATTAGKLTSPVNISMSGAVTATATAFDGSDNITIPATGLNASMLDSGVVPAERLPEYVFDDYGSANTVQGNVDAITAKIPSQASSSNQLADKAFVNSSVQTATANFRGSWDTWAAVPTDATEYPADYAGSKAPTVNDYLVVADASGYSISTLEGTWRFKYSGVWSTDGKNGWHPEYQVNETPLTAAQIAALNSNITAADKTKLDGIEANANKYTHPDSGVTAGTYRSVTVNVQGHVTGGTNPTTLSGYGITDAAPSSAVPVINTTPASITVEDNTIYKWDLSGVSAATTYVLTLSSTSMRYGSHFFLTCGENASISITGATDITGETIADISGTTGYAEISVFDKHVIIRKADSV